MKMTREQILEAYEAGPEAVVALVQSLLARIEQLERVVEQTTARVENLERRLSRDSRNSHKPPSSDGLSKAKTPKNLRQKSGRKRGGQRGHPGQTLFQVEDPERVVPHMPHECAHCGVSLLQAPVLSVERRQVFDLPPLALAVTEHQAQTKRCTHCGETTQAAFPPQVRAPAQYGPGVLALGVYLQQYQLLPYARTQELLVDLFGAAPSQATLGRALEEAGGVLVPLEEQIRQALARAEQAHFDETGLRVAGRLHWLHVVSTEQLTYYRLHEKRGREAHEAIGILPDFGGVAVHDAYPSLLCYGGRHALCNAHLLRELLALEERHDLWATALAWLLRQMKQEADAARAEGAPSLPVERQAILRSCFERILAYAEERHPPPRRQQGQTGRLKQSPARNLLDRLRKHPEKVLAFVADLRVPFDNNLAERDLRMAKLKQKISGGFRTPEGAATFCRLRGYISTLRKQGTHVLSSLHRLFTADAYLPLPSPG